MAFAPGGQPHEPQIAMKSEGNQDFQWESLQNLRRKQYFQRKTLTGTKKTKENLNTKSNNNNYIVRNNCIFDKYLDFNCIQLKIV